VNDKYVIIIEILFTVAMKGTAAGEDLCKRLSTTLE
jgi:hypothetical protein